MASDSDPAVTVRRPRGGVLPVDRLSLGIQLPVQAQSPRFAQGWEQDAGPAELAAVAEAADRAGFAYVAVCDHVAIPTDLVGEMGATWYDATATLGWLAARTRRTLLLSHVWVLPYRHPLQTAKGFATLDALSAGRAVLGVGAGHVEQEFATLGVPFAERGALLDEGIDAVRAAFAADPAAHAGPAWTYADLSVAPRPARAGGPPIWVGGSSMPALRRAAQRGDGWLPQGRPPMGMRGAVAWLREERARVHGDDLALDVGAHAGFVYVGTSPNDLGDAEASGPAEAVAERLRVLHEIGATHAQVMVRTRGAAELCEQIERIGSEVLPLLEGLEGPT